MDLGFLLDKEHGGTGRAKWAAGPPVRSFWLGIRVKKRDMVPVTTWRCRKCGYLESYANPE